jgi:predicted nucleic acid-binding protein
VKVVVDANIVVSTMLKTNGVVAELLLSAKPRPEFFVPEFVRTELSMHRSKMAKLTGASLDDLAVLEEVVLSGINTVSAERIDGVHWESATSLVADIDPKDDHYVALALHLKCPLWTGDKKLIAGLRGKAGIRVLDTAGLRKAIGEL